MSGRTRDKIEERDLQGFKFFKKIVALMERPPRPGATAAVFAAVATGDWLSISAPVVSCSTAARR